MNAEEIRAEAIDRIARVIFIEAPVRDAAKWDELREPARQLWRSSAESFVDALGDLLPTGEEISTCFPNEPAADDEAMRRYVTDWKEVSDA